MAAVSDAAVAIFPWGDVIEEFLDPLGLTIEDYAERMRGGWLFGYVAGLQAHGLRPLIIYASERVEAPLRLTHADTGAPIWLVPGRRTQTTQRPSLNAVRQWRRTPFGAFADILRSEACGAILVQDYEHPRFEALSLLGRRLKLPVFATFQGGDVTLSALERRVRQVFLGGRRAGAAETADWIAFAERNFKAMEAAGQDGRDIPSSEVIERGARWRRRGCGSPNAASGNRGRRERRARRFPYGPARRRGPSLPARRCGSRAPRRCARRRARRRPRRRRRCRSPIAAESSDGSVRLP